MSEETKSTGAITGITNFLFLAFILPGIVYLCFILVLFPFDTLEDLFPELEMSIDVAIGAVITLGLALTSIVFAVDIAFRKLFSMVSRPNKGSAPKQMAYAEIIFEKDRAKELGWYFWQLWGQSIMHENIAIGLTIIYVVYRCVINEIWPPSTWLHGTWRDWTLAVILANFICWRMFESWHKAVMAKL
jgi:hypothetical protein